MSARITGVHPPAACPGGKVTIHGEGFPIGTDAPEVRLGDRAVRLTTARRSRLTFIVPGGLPGGLTQVRVGGVQGESPVLTLGAVVATGLHQVDSPVFDAEGRLYVTFSGNRGQQVPVSVFRIGRDGTRESFVRGLVNPTSMAIGPDGLLYISSRFEGTVYRVDASGQPTAAVTDVGVACGIAFAPDGTMFVGDRSGTIFRVLQGGQATMMATLPSSVAAFHLAMGPDRALYVTAPTLTTRDAVFRVQLDGLVQKIDTGFGRPQGLAFGPDGTLYVIEALSGISGLYRLLPDRERDLVVSGEGLVGVAFDPEGGLVVASNDTAWRLHLPTS